MNIPLITILLILRERCVATSAKGTNSEPGFPAHHGRGIIPVPGMIYLDPARNNMNFPVGNAFMALQHLLRVRGICDIGVDARADQAREQPLACSFPGCRGRAVLVLDETGTGRGTQLGNGHRGQILVVVDDVVALIAQVAPEAQQRPGIEPAAHAPGEARNPVVDLRVDIPDTEMSSVLATRDDGTVYFFSMATSFTSAALGAEGIGHDAVMIIGNGYTSHHAEIALNCVRESPILMELFEEVYASGSGRPEAVGLKA